MEERRAARIGTVSGLALLAGGTAVAAVSGGTHSVFATVLLGLLAVGMGHALLDEIRRQARRRSVAGWVRHDTANTLLLAAWAAGALTATMMAVAPATVRAVGLALSLGYAVSCVYFVVERRRTIARPPVTPPPATSTAPTPAVPFPAAPTSAVPLPASPTSATPVPAPLTPETPEPETATAP